MEGLVKKKIHKIVFQWRSLRTICEKMLMAYGVKVLGMNFLLCCKKALVGILCIHRCQKWGTLFCWHRPLCCPRLGRQPRVWTGTSPATENSWVRAFVTITPWWWWWTVRWDIFTLFQIMRTRQVGGCGWLLLCNHVTVARQWWVAAPDLSSMSLLNVTGAS